MRNQACGGRDISACMLTPKGHIYRVDQKFANPLLLTMPMKTILRSLLGGLVAAAFVVVAQAADLAPGAFSAGTVKGDVSYKLAGTSQFLALTPGTSLPQGATIRTGESSLVAVVFSNGSVATVTSNSEVEITKFHQEAFTGSVPSGSEPSVSATEINLINGTVVSKVSKLKPGSTYIVNSPVGAAGVRGTTFSVSYNAQTRAYSVTTSDGLVVYSGIFSPERSVASGETYNGIDLARITPDQIRQIEDAIRGDIASRSVGGGGGQGPGNTSPPAPGGVDSSVIQVSPN